MKKISKTKLFFKQKQRENYAFFITIPLGLLVGYFFRAKQESPVIAGLSMLALPPIVYLFNKIEWNKRFPQPTKKERK